MSSSFFTFSGNGKIDRTPTPVDLRKIKRISFEVFLSLKELLKNFKARDLIFWGARGPRLNDLKTKMHPARPHVNIEQTTVRVNTYEPTNMADAYNSSLWQWRRVADWYRYINDPYENINGHMTT